MPRQVMLPDRMDRNGTRLVIQALMAARGDDVAIDGGAVRIVGTPGVQVLLAAARQWAMDGRRLTLAPLSADLAQALDRLGLGLADVTAGGAA